MTERRRAQSGVSLIEVLVSILILGLAMISLAGLQSYTVKYQMGSANRSVLAMLVSDYAERVRANMEAAPVAGAQSPYLFSADWDGQQDDPKAAGTDCGTEVCADAQALAQWDMANWRQRVRESLPHGSVQVSGNVQAGLNLTVMWQDNDYSATPPACAAGQSPADARQCCPVQVPKGVRCANFVIVP